MQGKLKVKGGSLSQMDPDERRYFGVRSKGYIVRGLARMDGDFEGKAENIRYVLEAQRRRAPTSCCLIVEFIGVYRCSSVANLV